MRRAARWAIRLRSSLRPRSLGMASKKLVTYFLRRALGARRYSDARSAFGRTEFLIKEVDHTRLAFDGPHSGLSAHPHGNDSARRRERLLGNAFHDCAHVADPDRQRRGASGFVAAQRL